MVVAPTYYIGSGGKAYTTFQAATQSYSPTPQPTQSSPQPSSSHPTFEIKNGQTVYYGTNTPAPSGSPSGINYGSGVGIEQQRQAQQTQPSNYQNTAPVGQYPTGTNMLDYSRDPSTGALVFTPRNISQPNAQGKIGYAPATKTTIIDGQQVTVTAQESANRLANIEEQSSQLALQQSRQLEAQRQAAYFQQPLTPAQQVIDRATNVQALQSQQVQAAMAVASEPSASMFNPYVPQSTIPGTSLGASMAGVGGLLSNLGRSQNPVNQAIVTGALAIRDKSIGMINTIRGEQSNIRFQQANLGTNLMAGLQTNEYLDSETAIARGNIYSALGQLQMESQTVAYKQGIASQRLLGELALLGLLPKGNAFGLSKSEPIDITKSPLVGKYVSTTQSTPEGEVTTTKFEPTVIGKSLIAQFSNAEELANRDAELTKSFRQAGQKGIAPIIVPEKPLSISEQVSKATENFIGGTTAKSVLNFYGQDKSNIPLTILAETGLAALRLPAQTVALGETYVNTVRQLGLEDAMLLKGLTGGYVVPKEATPLTSMVYSGTKELYENPVPAVSLAAIYGVKKLVIEPFYESPTKFVGENIAAIGAFKLASEAGGLATRLGSRVAEPLIDTYFVQTGVDVSRLALSNASKDIALGLSELKSLAYKPIAPIVDRVSLAGGTVGRELGYLKTGLVESVPDVLKDSYTRSLYVKSLEQRFVEPIVSGFKNEVVGRIGLPSIELPNIELRALLQSKLSPYTQLPKLPSYLTDSYERSLLVNYYKSAIVTPFKQEVLGRLSLPEIDLPNIELRALLRSKLSPYVELPKFPSYLTDSYERGLLVNYYKNALVTPIKQEVFGRLDFRGLSLPEINLRQAIFGQRSPYAEKLLPRLPKYITDSYERKLLTNYYAKGVDEFVAQKIILPSKAVSNEAKKLAIALQKKEAQAIDTIYRPIKQGSELAQAKVLELKGKAIELGSKADYALARKAFGEENVIKGKYKGFVSKKYEENLNLFLPSKVRMQSSEDKKLFAVISKGLVVGERRQVGRGIINYGKVYSKEPIALTAKSKVLFEALDTYEKENKPIFNALMQNKATAINKEFSYGTGADKVTAQIKGIQYGDEAALDRLTQSMNPTVFKVTGKVRVGENTYRLNESIVSSSDRGSVESIFKLKNKADEITGGQFKYDLRLKGKQGDIEFAPTQVSAKLFEEQTDLGQRVVGKLQQSRFEIESNKEVDRFLRTQSSANVSLIPKEGEVVMPKSFESVSFKGKGKSSLNKFVKDNYGAEAKMKQSMETFSIPEGKGTLQKLIAEQAKTKQVAMLDSTIVQKAIATSEKEVTAILKKELGAQAKPIKTLNDIYGVTVATRVTKSLPLVAEVKQRFGEYAGKKTFGVQQYVEDTDNFSYNIRPTKYDYPNYGVKSRIGTTYAQESQVLKQITLPQLERLERATKTDTQLMNAIKTQNATMLRNDTQLRQDTLTQSLTKLREDTLQRTQTRTDTQQLLKTRTELRQQTLQKTLTKTQQLFMPQLRIKLEEIPKPKIKLRPKFGTQPIDFVGDAKKQAYDFYVRRSVPKGRSPVQEVYVGRYPLKRGLNESEYIADNSSDSAIRYVPRGYTTDPDDLYVDRAFKFRQPKGKSKLRGRSYLVEDQKYRIDTQGEIQGITAKGLMALRKQHSQIFFTKPSKRKRR